MKKIALTAAALTTFATNALAGGAAYSTQSAPVMADTTAMASGSAWLIPLIALALIMLALSGSTNATNQPT